MTNFKSVKGLFGYKLEVATDKEKRIENYVKPAKNLGSKVFKVVAGENGVSVVSKTGENFGVFDTVCHSEGFRGLNQYFTAKKADKTVCFDSVNERMFPVIFETIAEFVDEDGHIFDIHNGVISRHSRPDKVMVENGKAKFIGPDTYLSLTDDGSINIMKQGEVEVENISSDKNAKISCTNRADTCALGTTFSVEEKELKKVYSKKLGRFVFEAEKDVEISRADNSKQTALIAFDAKQKKSDIHFFIEEKGAIRETSYNVPAKVVVSFYDGIGACVEYFKDGKRAYLDKDGKDISEAVSKYLRDRSEFVSAERERQRKQAASKKQEYSNGSAEAKMIAGLAMTALDKGAIGTPLFVEGMMEKVEEEIQKEN